MRPRAKTRRVCLFLRRTAAALLCLLFLLDSADASGRRRKRRKPRKRPAPAAAPAPAAGPATHALKPLESIGITKVRVDRADIRLVNLLAQIPGIRMVLPRTVKKLLGSRKGSRIAACGAELECAVDFGKALNVKHVVAGDMTQLGKGYVLSLKLVDVPTAKVVRRTTVVVRGSKLEQQQRLVEAAYRLLAPRLHTGKVQVAVDVKGAKIYLDGHLVATSPAPALTTSVGAHNLRVTHPAYHDYLRFLDIEFRKTVQLSVNLRAYPIISAKVGAKDVKGRPSPGAQVTYRPLPWYRRWYVVTAVSVGALLLAGAVTTTAVALSNRRGLDWDLSTVIRPIGR